MRADICRTRENLVHELDELGHEEGQGRFGVEGAPCYWARKDARSVFVEFYAGMIFAAGHRTAVGCFGELEEEGLSTPVDESDGDLGRLGPETGAMAFVVDYDTTFREDYGDDVRNG